MRLYSPLTTINTYHHWRSQKPYLIYNISELCQYPEILRYILAYRTFFIDVFNVFRNYLVLNLFIAHSASSLFQICKYHNWKSLWIQMDPICVLWVHVFNGNYTLNLLNAKFAFNQFNVFFNQKQIWTMIIDKQSFKRSKLNWIWYWRIFKYKTGTMSFAWLHAWRRNRAWFRNDDSP